MNLFKIIITLTFLSFDNFNSLTVSAFLINGKYTNLQNREYINNQNTKYISRNNLYKIKSNENKFKYIHKIIK